jgi:DNA-binding transcriptional MerR regulator
MSNYSIKDMESITGIKAHTIRIWEKRYSLIQPERTSTNIRLYNDEELVHLINVGALVKHGHKISKLSKLSKNEVSKVIENIAVTESNHDALISQLIDAMVELNESKFLELFDQTTHSMDFEHTIIELIFPLMERIGTMWTIGSIIPGHEHFLSNLIRQKMISNIDKLASPYECGQTYFFTLFTRWRMA